MLRKWQIFCGETGNRREIKPVTIFNKWLNNAVFLKLPNSDVSLPG